MDMTKFEGEDDPGFITVVGELRRWIKELTSPSNVSVPITERPQQQRQAEQQQQVEQHYSAQGTYKSQLAG